MFSAYYTDQTSQNTTISKFFTICHGYFYNKYHYLESEKGCHIVYDIVHYVTDSVHMHRRWKQDLCYKLNAIILLYIVHLQWVP